MEFPGRNHLRQIRKTFFPTSADRQEARESALAEFLAEAEARQAARDAMANDLRRGCASRLGPYIGRLFLVTNFKGVRLEENAARIRDAVLAPANLGVDVSIGISAVLSEGRGNHGQLVETAGALEGSLKRGIDDRAFLLRPQRESSDLWPLSLARAAEDTTRLANVPPEELGCIAVVSALDMSRHADIRGIPAPGTAFRLTQISENTRFGWETVSMHPDAWEVAARQEMQPPIPDSNDFR